MADFYRTTHGETWDEIALEVYGDESRADVLMRSNYDLLDTMIFSAGEIVYTPEITEGSAADDPPWIGDDEEEEDPYL